jgi:hypothetical protein
VHGSFAKICRGVSLDAIEEPSDPRTAAQDIRHRQIGGFAQRIG